MVNRDIVKLLGIDDDSDESDDEISVLEVNMMYNDEEEENKDDWFEWGPIPVPPPTLKTTGLDDDDDMTKLSGNTYENKT